MLTIWAYAWYARRRSARRYVLVAVLFACGLMAKPMLVTLPFLLLLLDFWPLGRLQFSRDREGESDAGNWRGAVLPLLLEKLPLLALSVFSSVLTLIVQRNWGAVTDSLPFALRMANAVVSYVAYIGKMLWPARLAIFYPPHAASLSPLMVAGSALLLIVISAAALLAVRRRPYLSVGWFWYIGTLVPVIGLVQVGDQAMADRYAYTPLIGLYLVLAWGLSEAASAPIRRTVLPAAAAAIVLVCMATARAQLSHWRSDDALWQHTAAVTGSNYLAEIKLGNLLVAQGRNEEALTHYQEAVRIRPGSPEAHNSLGAALANQEKWAEAIPHYREAVRLRPSYPEAHGNLGNALSHLDRHAEAEEQFAAAIRGNPLSPTLHSNRGLALLRAENPPEAAKAFREAARLEPSNPDHHYNLAAALQSAGDTPAAIAELRQALALNPNHTAARQALAALDD